MKFRYEDVKQNFRLLDDKLQASEETEANISKYQESLRELSRAVQNASGKYHTLMEQKENLEENVASLQTEVLFLGFDSFKT